MPDFKPDHDVSNFPIINFDEGQRPIARHLETLAQTINQHLVNKTSLLKSFFSKTPKPPRGAYIWGDVGRGKTTLMDLFFQKIKTPKKQRVHFHAFMRGIHQQRSVLKVDDVISVIANGIAKNTNVLCLDEMQIADIADAMIMGRLFEALLQRGVCIITTSNQPPDKLYKDGLNRHLFLPFIAKLNAELDVLHLVDGKDYRLGRIADRQTYLWPLNDVSRAACESIWQDLTDGQDGHPDELEFLGRTLHVPKASHACARFKFSDLCESPLAAPDYLAIAENYRTVFVENIPALKASQRNEAKRFILMIDTFYDSKTRLVITAEVAPELLCQHGQHRAEFLRTASRLQEMQSASWWKTT